MMDLTIGGAAIKLQIAARLPDAPKSPDDRPVLKVYGDPLTCREP